MHHHPLLYEINTLWWLEELSRDLDRDITLGEVPREKWNELRDLGFHYIWLMGIWKRSRLGIQIFQNDPDYRSFKLLCDAAMPGWREERDLVGSPYSIASYTPDPAIGDWNDIERARKEINSRGMGLILDFVPNHTAPDHPWVSEHTEYYVKGTAEDYGKHPQLFTGISSDAGSVYFMRGKDPYFPPWTDTLQLNYLNPELHKDMLKELRNILDYCDGVRCDMAMLVLNDIFTRNWARAVTGAHAGMPEQEFWQKVRETFPAALLIAEAYWDTELRLQQLGFDYTYDKDLYDKLLHASPRSVHMHVSAEQPYQAKLVRFIENHDEKRSPQMFVHGNLKAAATLFSTLPGMKLYYDGQLEGRKTRCPIQLRRERQEPVDGEIRSFYRRLLSITKNEVFRRGAWELLQVMSQGNIHETRFIAYTWRLKDTLKLIVINLSPEALEGRVLLDFVLPGRKYVFHDELNNEDQSRQGIRLTDSGLNVSLEAFQPCIFDINYQG
jgi:hypothetical protein